MEGEDYGSRVEEMRVVMGRQRVEQELMREEIGRVGREIGAERGAREEAEMEREDLRGRMGVEREKQDGLKGEVEMVKQ